VCHAQLPEGADPQRSLCPRCDALDALSEFETEQRHQAQRQAASQDRAHDWKRWRPVILGVVIALSLFVMAIRIPALTDSLRATEKPMRRGTWNTDARTDECINLLWRVSGRLQKGLAPDPIPICPASGQPFDVRTDADDVIVRSPAPQLYGLKEIRVSKRRPVPELIR